MILIFLTFLYSQNILKQDIYGVYYFHQKIETDAPNLINLSFVSDIHGAMHKWPRLISYLNENEDTLLILGGDYAKGEANFDLREKGKFIYELISKTKNIAVAAIGNHDLDKDSPDILKIIEEYNIPLISSNLINIKDNKYAYPAYLIREYKDKKFLFLSFLNENIYSEDTIDKKAINVVQAYTNILKLILNQFSIDEIILVNHLNLQEIYELTNATSSLKVQFNGHIHIPNITQIKNKNNDNVLTVFGAFRNRVVQNITLFYDAISKRYLYLDNSYKLFNLENYSKDTDTEILIQNYLETVPIDAKYSYLNEVLFIFNKIDKTKKFDSNRSYLANTQLINTPLTDLITDAFSTISNASVAFINADGIRKSIKQKPENNYEVKGIDIYNVLPFQQQLCVAYMSGEQIYTLSNIGIFNFTIHRRMYFNGLIGTIKDKKFIIEKIYNPTTRTYETFNLEKSYKVVFTDYYSDINPSFKRFLELNNINYTKTGLIDHLVLIWYIKYLNSSNLNWIDRYLETQHNFTQNKIPTLISVRPPTYSTKFVSDLSRIKTGIKTLNTIKK